LHSGVLEKKPEMKEKYFCIVEDEAQHLLALINRLLTISKLEHGKLHIQKAEVDLETMIEDVVDKYKAKSAKPIHIITRFGATSALADEEYLKEAISNLVDNATKYSKEEINIEISTLEDDRNVYIKVFDEGIGIAKSELKTIFNRFERAAEHEKDARKTRGGFGIGLNYVLQVINAHGGKISVKSEKDKWSEFTISLPK
ncbi:MAG: sensor histidine kinase, partial [Segatella copri]